MSQPLTNLGLYGNFSICDSDIISGLNANFQLLDNLVQLAFTGFVPTLPEDPTEGDKYILPDGTINLWNGSEWIMYPAQEGYIGYNKGDGFIYFYDGTEWKPLPAELIFFDNTGTTIVSDNLQGAILELIAMVEGLPLNGIDNVGGGAEVYKDTTSGTANLRTLVGKNPIQTIQETDEIKIDFNVNDISEGDLLTLKRTPVIGAWTEVPVPTKANYMFATNGNGVIIGVALNTTTTIRSIDNGRTWIAGGTLPNQQWRRIVYGNGVFVIVSGNGTTRCYRTLDNGATWIPATTFNNTLNYANPIFVNGKFIAPPQSNTNAQVSTDNGNTWSSVALVAGQTMLGLVKIEDNLFRYISSSTEDFILDSAFNIIGSSTKPSGINFYNAAYGNGVVIISDNNGNNMYVSYDNTFSLTKISNIPFAFGNNIAFGNGIFFITNQSNVANRAAYTPNNGESWVVITTDLDNPWSEVVHSLNSFIFLPYDSGPDTIAAYVDVVINKTIGSIDKKSVDRKNPSCIAVQRTTNGGASGVIGASDDSAIVAATDYRRRLNFLSTNAPDFFEIVNSGLANNFVNIKKPGKFKLKGSSMLGRSGESYCYIIAYALGTATTIQRIDRGQIYVATASAAAASMMSIITGGIIEVTPAMLPAQISLWIFCTTKTANFNAGRFYCDSGKSVDTAFLEIEYLGE